MKKCYIAGPISGLDYQKAYDAFRDAEMKLTSLGYEPVNPMRLPHNHDKSWSSYMREDLKQLLDCEFVYLLDGWQDSKGARIEAGVAVSLGIKVVNPADSVIIIKRSAVGPTFVEFICDLCGKTYHGVKHAVRDENYNVISGLISCEKCFINQP